LKLNGKKGAVANKRGKMTAGEILCTTPHTTQQIHVGTRKTAQTQILE
jgi:hypothetical protein